MSIRTELKKKWQKETGNYPSIAEQKLKRKAAKFIKEFIIPQFREISAKRPTMSELNVRFH